MFNFVKNLTIGNIKHIMKKLFLVLVILSFVENTMAQLKMAQFPEKEKKEVIITYDSLTNVRDNNSEDYNDRFKHLVGQKITSFQSSDFWVDMLINGKSHYETDIQNMIDGKTFKIDSVNRYTFYMTSEENPNNHFSLSILGSDDLYKIDFAWVCHGYFDKIKDLYLGKDLVYIHNDKDYDIDDSRYNTYRFMDYDSKRNLMKKIPCNSVWKCTDVLVIADRVKYFGFPDFKNRVILNVENEQYGKYYIYAYEFIERKGNTDPYIEEYFMTMEDFHKYQAVQNQLREAAKAKAAKAAAESEKRAKEHREYIIAKYGETYGSLILQGRVVIGMTKDQCIEALGHPTRINRTTTALTVYEQWVYGGRYLYFENGKLVTIQD